MAVVMAFRNPSSEFGAVIDSNFRPRSNANSAIPSILLRCAQIMRFGNGSVVNTKHTFHGVPE
jgi:hypothetical protein